MPTVFVSGDMCHHPALKAFAHGCNCAGAMGKGIALEFRERFPRMYAEYKRRCTEGRFALGDVFVWSDAGGVTVFNLATQATTRTRADIQAIDTALARMLAAAVAAQIDRIGLPRVGAGLGGLPWEAVRALLEKVGAATAIELIVFETYVPRSIA
ncbi:MAG TPA: macro domain-containing protein [Polyangia bacterium]|jgi:O-acetyl-ADP-ribose deacetylase (regulator of RNase III)